MRKGAVVLCGGQSSRMGRDKSLLPFGTELMLQRVVRIVSEAVNPECVVVVAADNQSLPTLPTSVKIVRDEVPFHGPLEGLVRGIQTLIDSVDAVYATSCDVPLLTSPFIDQMFNLLGENEIAVPQDGEHYHPLAAVYRVSVVSAIQQLLNAGELRPRMLFGHVNTYRVDSNSLREVDPELRSLINLNRPEDYQRALDLAQLSSDSSFLGNH